MRAIALAALIAPLVAAGVARADCKQDVADLQPQVDQAQPGRTKELLAFDLKRAQRELGEGDEDECQEAVDHARKLLRGEE